MINRRTLTRVGKPTDITDNNCRIHLVTDPTVMPTYSGAKAMAYGAYGDELIIDELLKLIKSVSDVGSASDDEMVDMLIEDFQRIDISNAKNKVSEAGVLLVFESGNGVLFAFEPDILAHDRAVPLTRLLDVTRLDKNARFIHQTSTEAEIRTDLLKQLMPQLPLSGAPGGFNPIEAFFTVVAFMDPYSSLNYSVYGVKENRLFVEVRRSNAEIAELIRGCNLCLRLSNIERVEIP
jgi:hypothetical protein